MDLLEAAALRAWAVAARTALGAAADRIDAVNVFPVADSDTGTNVLLTVVGGADAVALVPADAAAADVARAFGRGALLAARGNSGVIVSQYLTGFARALPARAGAPEVAHALAVAARAAREATVEPQEGTVLTLADVVAGAAVTAADAGADLPTTLAESVAEALRALGRISAVHPVLRAARVLDAGACALLVVLDALARAVGDERPVHVPLDWLPTTAADHASVEPTGGAYEVMLLVSDDGAGDGCGRHRGRAPTAHGCAGGLGGRRRRGRLVARARPHRPADRRDRRGRAGPARAGPRPPPRRGARGRVGAARPGGRSGAVGCRGLHRRAGPRRLVRGGGCGRAGPLPRGAGPRRAPRARGHGHGGGARGPPAGNGCGGLDGAVRPGRGHRDARRGRRGARRRRSLALAGEGPTAQGRTAAQAALARLGVRTVEAASVHAVADAVDALVRTPRPTPAESLTVLGRDAPDGELLDALVAHLATHHPGIEATVVGPTGHGPALVLGLD